MDAARNQSIVVPRATEVTAVAGRGMSAVVRGRQIRLGSTRYMNALRVNTESLAAAAAQMQQQGRTVSWVADVTDTPEVLGMLAFGDTVKPSSQQAVAQLQALGIKTVLVTGCGPIGAMTVIAAETDAEADYLASSQDQSFVRLRTGDPGKLPPPIRDYRASLPEASHMMLARMDAARAVGSPATVSSRMGRFIERTQADEIIVSGATYDPEARHHSLKLVAEVLNG